MATISREKLDQRLLKVRLPFMELLENLPAAAWESPVYTEPEIWTVADTVRHILQAEKSMVRLMEGIRQGHPGTPEGFDLNAYNRKGIDMIKERQPADLLPELITARENTIRFFDSLAEDDWEKRGRHAIGQVMTIYEIGRLIAIHEKGHMRDIEQVLG